MSHSGHDTGASTGGTTGGTVHATMVPYFHFTPGDHLFLKVWVPKSAGAIAGACIGLFFLALLERWLTGMRGVFDEHWKHRAQLLASKYSTASKGRSASPSSIPSGKQPYTVTEDGTVEEAAVARIPSSIPRLRIRTIPPFVASHDIPRGILYAFQSSLGYLLMLAVMSYRVEFILCIIAGLGVGETLFGRLSSGKGH